METSSLLMHPLMALHLRVDPDGALKMGTCQHCVVEEHGRPERAWDADGDTDLDFERDALLTELQAFGVAVTIADQYICP